MQDKDTTVYFGKEIERFESFEIASIASYKRKLAKVIHYTFIAQFTGMIQLS